MPHLSPEVAVMAEKHKITFPPSLPIYKSPPNYVHLGEWADSQATPKLREIAHKMIDRLQYVSFDTFLEKLRKVVADFNKKIGNEPYVMVATGVQFKADNGCSDRWVPAVALEYAQLKAPNGIVTIFELPMFLEANPHIKNMLIIDDASYSGMQMLGSIGFLITGLQNLSINVDGMNLHVVTPYVTKSAKQKICTSIDEETLKMKLVFTGSEEMPTITEILEPSDINYLDKIGYFFGSDSVTFTYFDHRVADFFSFVQNLYDGKMLSFDYESLYNLLGYTKDEAVANANSSLILITKDKEKEFLPDLDGDFLGYNIPQVIKAYGLTDNDYKDLESGIKHGRVGLRSDYKIVNPEMEKIVSETMEHDELVKECPYKKVTIPLDKQQEFDAKMTTPRPMLRPG